MIQVLNKVVDKSVLSDGITLPINVGPEITLKKGEYLQRGQSKTVTIILEDAPYDVKVININNSLEKRPKDQFQIRYGNNSPFSKALKAVFQHSYHYITEERKKLSDGTRKQILPPENQREYLVIYTTDKPDVFEAEAIHMNGISDFLSNNYTEEEIETLLSVDRIDPNASVEEAKKLVKIRKLDRTIAQNLKDKYSYRCQICGQKIGETQGVHCCESHHIDYFSRSWNNEPSNQMILCPNHHRIIHKADPVFDKTSLCFHYNNGYREKLKINLHLGPMFENAL